MTIEFDFYEIDSWDFSSSDSLKIDIDGITVPLGNFGYEIDEGTRSGVVSGIRFQTVSQGAPAQRCFQGGADQSVHWQDQKHHVTVTVPSTYFSDGHLSVRFETTLDGPRDDESAGFDNILIIAHRSCGLPTLSPVVLPAPQPVANPTPVPTPVPTPALSQTCVRDQVLVTEDFENRSISGWTSGKLDYCPYFTNFLGRYGNGDDYPSKTFTNIPTDASTVTIEFDFYEIDSWESFDQDSVFIDINGVKIPLGVFDSRCDEGVRSFMVGDIYIETRSQGAPANLCFGSGDKYWWDQKHHVTVSLPKRFYMNGSLCVKFEIFLTSGFDNESAGFDNIQITAHRPCDTRQLVEDVDSEASFRVNSLSDGNDDHLKNPMVVVTTQAACEELSKQIDILSVSVDKCVATPAENLIEIISQDGNSVTFSVSQSLTGCEDGKELRWLATDFVDHHDELVCFTETNVKCGHVNTYTAHCDDGMTVIDVFASDGTGDILRQIDGSSVFAPDACTARGDDTKTCHFRYLLQCMPSLCQGQVTKTNIRHLGSSTK